MSAGAMHYRLAFDAPVESVNATGGQVTGWQERIAAVWAQMIFLRGGEAVIAARLVGRQPAVVKVWASAATRAIDTDWRMRDLRSGVIYAIRSKVVSDDRSMVELTVESGVEP